MTEPTVTYNQNLAQVIPSLETVLAEMRAAPDRAELTDVTPDDAFELGYETAIFDLKRFTGDDPLETGIIRYFPKEDTDD